MESNGRKTMRGFYPGKCQGKTRKDGARSALFLVVVLLYVVFVLFHVFLCSTYCLFCDVPCIVCVYMCTEQLPPGGYPIAVKYISYQILQLISCSYTTRWTIRGSIPGCGQTLFPSPKGPSQLSRPPSHPPPLHRCRR